MSLNVSLKQIRYFVAVAEALHFGHAAARLNVVQPAVSQQVRLLEAELNLELFDRASRKVALTDAGKAYLTEARRLLRQFDLAAQAAQDAANGLTGRLTIGFVDNALWSPLPRIIRTFGAQVPQVELALLQMSRVEQLSSLRNRALDVAIVPGPIADPELNLQELARERIYVVLPHGHRLCDRVEIGMGELAGETFIAIPAVDNPRRINELVFALCGEAGFVPRFGQAVDQLHTAISLVGAGLGIAIVPRWMCQTVAADVDYRPVSPRSDYILLIATARDNNRPIIDGFLRIARENI